MHEKSVVLDTCALLWLASDDPRLSSSARRSIEDASNAFVSAISAWEISLKHARGVLELPLPPKEWFMRAMAAHRLLLAPLDIDVLTSANDLPWHHRDPADRFIIATARKEKAAVITADVRFAAYGITILC
jgi:PIN domain nuclease of toxin-antitoxin system